MLTTAMKILLLAILTLAAFAGIARAEYQTITPDGNGGYTVRNHREPLDPGGVGQDTSKW